MATRTAPAVTGAINKSLSTIHLIDASGDQTSVALETVTAPTVANIEAWVAAYQANTQASTWLVTQTNFWLGDRDPDNADVGQRNSVKAGVNLLWKNLTTLKNQGVRAIAPIAASMQGNQDIPLLTGTEFAAMIAATATILAGYSLDSAQYSDRSERANNPRIKA